MTKGFAEESTPKQAELKKKLIKEPKGRLISWSPWPPANFKTRYPAFPFVLTVIILIIGQWYLSIAR